MQRGQLDRFMEMPEDLQGVRMKNPQPGTATLKFTIESEGTIQFPVKVNLGSIGLFQPLGLDKKEGQQGLPGQGCGIDGLKKGRMVAKAQVALEPDDFSGHGMIL